VFSLSTLNRIMTVELALPALLPGFLVGIHYAVQILRPRWGYGSDAGGRRTPWIIGGMAVLALGGAGASAATALMASSLNAGLIAALLAYVAIGLGAGAAGTSLLVLLAKSAGATRAAIAGPIAWIMMILGFALSAGLSGRFLDPFSPSRLMAVGASVAGVAFFLALLGVWGIERGDAEPSRRAAAPTGAQSFFKSLREVWAESETRQFAFFIFISMLAFSGQELVLEPFGGTVFGLTPGDTAQLSGLLHAGAFVGMITGILGVGIARRFGGTVLWMVIAGGCLGSALAQMSLVYGGAHGAGWPIHASVAVLGFANGVYAVSAIGAMMSLTASAKRSTAGTHMGIWGAAQGVASGLGGLLATGAADAMRAVSGSAHTAYLLTFSAEALLFLVAALLAIRASRGAEHAVFSRPASADVSVSASAAAS
jgi:BCD family chlorophyll transporter-like MFS transporter